MVSNCGPPEKLGQTMGKEMSAEQSKRNQMLGPGKTFWETRNLDTVLRNLMQALRFSTANVETLIGKSAEVVDILSRRTVGVAVLQEVQYNIVGTKIVKEGDAAYKLYWSGESTGRDGVGLMVHVSLVKINYFQIYQPSIDLKIHKYISPYNGGGGGGAFAVFKKKKLYHLLKIYYNW